ncbi:hypothetical protein RUND412_000596 [Rhizina undulata]
MGRWSGGKVLVDAVLEPEEPEQSITQEGFSQADKGIKPRVERRNINACKGEGPEKSQDHVGSGGSGVNGYYKEERPKF